MTSSSPTEASASPVTTRRTGLPAASIAGLGELIDFILPLWAASTLKLSPSLIGAVLAVELATAIIARPIAGKWADRADRRLLISAGAGIFAAGLLTLSIVGSVPFLFLASILLGLGSAFFWVPLRAVVAESANPQQAFSKLTSAEGTGIWVVYIIALSALPFINFQGVYAIGAVAALGAAVYIALGVVLKPSPQENLTDCHSQTSATIDHKNLLIFVALVALVEAAASIYLLLCLQEQFGLELMEIVWLYLPGLVVYSVVPQWGIPLVQALGQRVLVFICLGLSVVGISLVTLFPEPWVLALGWAFLCCSWGWLDPLQQSTATRVIPGGFGRAFGRYEAATLIGGALGSLAGGFTLQIQMPLWVCLAAMIVVLTMIPLTVSLYPSSPSTQLAKGNPARSKRDPRKEWHKALEHLLLYAIVQGVLAVADRSWVAVMLSTGNPLSRIEGQAFSAQTALYIGTLIWGGVVILDLVISGTLFKRSLKKKPQQ
ncbi:MAG: MFS transporter [Rothia sp. (in: high G+C Gram-positive bacteria)]|nr:MFS transporter [Rothia sp. (in: high G+C Gram-positive bacteria)]